MIKIISQTIKRAQSDWLDEVRDVDWGKDDVDWPSGYVNNDNLQDFLIDDLQNTDVLDAPKNQSPNQNLVPAAPAGDDYMSEIPKGSADLGIPEDTREVEYASSSQLINDGITRNEVVSFEYTNRHGAYAGLRTVEPHYTFMAYSTGNEILVTFDRDVQDIRAFIVGNMHPNGVRYDGIKFSPRPEIMNGVQG